MKILKRIMRLELEKNARALDINEEDFEQKVNQNINQGGNGGSR